MISQLQQGDRFELSGIIVGYPLYISRILRDGAYTPSYVADQIDGIKKNKHGSILEQIIKSSGAKVFT